jgi:hypothetical protein
MKRREFLTAGTASLVVTTATVANETPVLAQSPSAQEFVEVRKYAVKDADKRAKLVEILDKALIPALNRQGIKPVGVFTALEADVVPAREKERDVAKMSVFVVFPHKTTATAVSANAKLLADATYRKDAAPIFETTSRDPVYTDCETFLLYNFPTIPVLETPQLGPNRIFQMRLYRSFNIERNAAKIHMFDKGGELPLFREVGLNPIFFGDIVAGNRLPAFLYMFGCSSIEARNTSWKNFIDSPKWAAMKDLPEYKDTATEIDNYFLKPSPGSQI